LPKQQETPKPTLSNQNKTTKFKPKEEEDDWNEVGKRADKKEESKNQAYT